MMITQTGRLHGVGQAMRRRALAGPTDATAGVEQYDGLQFNTGLLPYDVTPAYRLSDGAKATLKQDLGVARIYFGQFGNLSLPATVAGESGLYVLELAPQGAGQFWQFYRDSPAAAATIASPEWVADVPARSERMFFVKLKPGELTPYDPDKVVDSYTGPFGPDDRGLETAAGKGLSKDPADGSGKAVGPKKSDGTGGAGGAGAGGGSGGSGSGGIDIGIPGLGLGPNWKLPDLSGGLLILLLVVGGGLILANKAVRG